VPATLAIAVILGYEPTRHPWIYTFMYQVLQTSGSRFFISALGVQDFVNPKQAVHSVAGVATVQIRVMEDAPPADLPLPEFDLSLPCLGLDKKTHNVGSVFRSHGPPKRRLGHDCFGDSNFPGCSCMLEPRLGWVGGCVMVPQGSQSRFLQFGFRRKFRCRFSVGSK
jgi:hypothetical protein